VAPNQAANGSPIVSKGRVFLTTPEDDEGKGRSLYCFERETGKQLWVQTVGFGRVMPTHKTNSYGGSTPASDGEWVVVWHASAGLHCYSLAGKKLWKRDPGEFRDDWVNGTSPVLRDGKIILHTGPGKRELVTALDMKRGETLWETDEPDFRSTEDIGASRRVLVHAVEQRRARQGVVVCDHATRVVGYSLATGAIVWT
jgi:outer membrane protein assembly factor BamB